MKKVAKKWEKKQASSRIRSVTLDPLKVRKVAKKRSIKNGIEFETALGILFGENNTTADKAWNGKKFDIQRAKKLAFFLGLKDYSTLLPTNCPYLGFPEPRVWKPQCSTPGALLQAEYGIVRFHHREKELEDLEAWCLNDEPLAIRLYTGAGGMGKTRLAIEQCQCLVRKYQWHAGFLRQKSIVSASEDESESFSWLAQLEQSSLIVIDYAETRREELVLLLRAALQQKVKLRIILLARSVAEWWHVLKTERDGVGELLMSPATTWLMLQPLSLTLAEKKQSFLWAADDFAAILKHDPFLTMPDDLDADYFESVLLLHMQALMSIENKQNEKEIKAVRGIQGILSAILNRERRFWETRANDKKLPKMLHSTIAQAMVRITMMGGVKDNLEVAQVLDGIPLLADSKYHERATIIKLLHDLYPCHQRCSVDDNNVAVCNYIEPLQPDLLGEHLMQEELEKDDDAILSFVFT